MQEGGRRSGVAFRVFMAEFIGAAFLLAGVVGSGIMADRLSEDAGVVLLAGSAATAGVLLIIIYVFTPVSGAHFNPVVTFCDVVLGSLRWVDVMGYVAVQLLGGAFGVILANLMFDLDAVTWSTTVRAGSHLWLAEVVATYGLVLVVFMLTRSGRMNSSPVRWPPISVLLSGSRRPPRSRIQSSPLLVHSRTPSLGSNPPQYRCSCRCNSWGLPLLSRPFDCWLRHLKNSPTFVGCV